MRIMKESIEIIAPPLGVAITILHAPIRVYVKREVAEFALYVQDVGEPENRLGGFDSFQVAYQQGVNYINERY